MPKIPGKKILRPISVIGIDPGKKGGIVEIDCEGLEYSVMPKTANDIAEHISHLHDEFSIDCVFVEHVTAMKGWGVTATMTFGIGYGVLLGVIATLQVPLVLVKPKVWQKELGITPRKTRRGETKLQFKERLRAKAQQLFPKLGVWSEGLGKQRAVCDALLIAYYGRRIGR